MKLVVLGLLYLAEGLPFGLQTQVLPLLLREQGLSLQAISSIGALTAPWLFKPLWAPLVDRYGTRRQWILRSLGLMILVSVATLATPGLTPLLIGLGVLNVVAATLDIAVDGLAVESLGPRELGPGNIAQVVGYKAGMLLGGWAIAQVAVAWGSTGVVAGMVPILLVVLLVFAVARLPEPARAPERETMSSILAVLGRAVGTPTGAWVVACVATYKLGESLIDPMFKLFVKDAGFPVLTVVRWTAMYGLGASILGSIAGGLLAVRLPLRRALFLAAALRLGPLVAEWLIAARPPVEDAIVLAIVGENFFGGALTTVMFAFMMQQVDRRIGATHYTVLAGVEVLGKMPAAYVSGWLAGAFGYAPTFALGVVLSGAYLLLLLLGPRPKLEPA